MQDRVTNLGGPLTRPTNENVCQSLYGILRAVSKSRQLELRKLLYDRDVEIFRASLETKATLEHFDQVTAMLGNDWVNNKKLPS